MNLIAHRGFSSKCPENTFASFNMAIENGFNIIELDVQLTKDKMPIIIHDYNIDRTTDGQGMVSEINYREISKLDAGSWFNKSFAEERIPTLKDVLDRYIDNAHLQIELKSDDLDLPEVVIDLINERGWRDNLNDVPYKVPGFSITS
ncbi:MAG: glycerophosphodiester phosphodiesterase family protein, partial [Chloroflexota bacterium]|nr:glycerophosphodiester phosphodiesterase family protein [Chloroflexota bacterium]